MKALFVVLAAAALLGGCAGPKTVTVDVPFNAEQARAMIKPGRNMITGSGLIRLQRGGVFTCAGEEVDLIPATEYAKRRFAASFGTAGYSPYRTRVKFANTPSGYSEIRRTATCDAQGFFKFDKLADGDFFVTTQIVWSSNQTYQGGSLMQRVTVSGGEQKDVVLSNR